MLELGDAARSAGFRAEHVAEIGSTNAELLTRAGQGDPGRLWLVADAQSSGRGRNARQWSSPPGNFYGSLMLVDPAPSDRLAQLSFVAALALRDAVLKAAGLYDDRRLALKWPNDLMAEGRKTAGMLLEGGASAGRRFVVIGIGVNVGWHPDGTNHPATNLNAAGFVLDRDSLFAALSDTMSDRLAQWAAGVGFAGIRRDWLKVAHGLGGPLRVNTVAESFDGVFETIDEDGRLVARTTDGPRIVSAADVFVLGTPPPHGKGLEPHG